MVVTTLAGSVCGTTSGDGGAPTAAVVSALTGLTTDTLNSIYLSDTVRVRKVSAGLINTAFGADQTFAGDGAAASLATISTPTGVWAGLAGNIFFSDVGSFRIRRVDSITKMLYAECLPPPLDESSPQWSGLVPTALPRMAQQRLPRQLDR